MNLIKAARLKKPQPLAMDNEQDKPPLFKYWSQWYALVLGFLILLIILFYLFTKAFS